MAEKERKEPKKKKPKRSLNEMGWVSKKEVLLFTKNIAVLLKAGSTLSESIRVLEGQAKGKWLSVVRDVRMHTEKGISLAEALNRHPKVFSSIYRGMVEIGQQSGTLEENLAYVAEHLDKSYKLKKKIKGAMMYPIIVMVGTVVLGSAVALFVLPKLTKLFDSFQIDLPITTRILIAVSDFFQHHGVIATSLTVGSIVFFVVLFRRKFMRPVSHWLTLHLPILKRVSFHMNLAMFCRTLGILLTSGTSIDEALAICSKTTSNYYYARYVDQAHKQVKGGEQLSDILKKKPKLFPATDTQIIQVGEASGTLSDSLSHCAVSHEDEVEDITKNLATMLEPIILLVLGGMVALLALSIITPIYSITDRFKA